MGGQRKPRESDPSPTVTSGPTSPPRGRYCSHGKVSVPRGAEGGTAEGVEAVDEDERAGQVLPPLGDGVPHLVQAQVELLDHVSVAVPHVGGPGQEEVVRRLPHALKGRDRNNKESS